MLIDCSDRHGAAIAAGLALLRHHYQNQPMIKSLSKKRGERKPVDAAFGLPRDAKEMLTLGGGLYSGDPAKPDFGPLSGAELDSFYEEVCMDLCGVPE